MKHKKKERKKYVYTTINIYQTCFSPYGDNVREII